MIPTQIKCLLGLSIFLTILLAGWYPFKKGRAIDNKPHEHDFTIGETLATGVFLGAGLLHMLPEASHLFHQYHYHYPLAHLITGATFLVFLWLEHVSEALYRAKNHAQRAFTCIAWFMLSVHSIILGAALGFSDQYSMVMMLFLAIITHKWAESFALAVQIVKAAFKPWLRTTLFLCFASMTPLGIFFGWYFEHTTPIYPLINPTLIAASAGTFLYLGTLHGLERCVLVERCCNLTDFSFVIIGFLLMGAVAIYL